MGNPNMVTLIENIICHMHNVSQLAYFPQISNIQCNVIGTHTAVRIKERFFSLHEILFITTETNKLDFSCALFTGGD